MCLAQVHKPLESGLVPAYFVVANLEQRIPLLQVVEEDFRVGAVRAAVAYENLDRWAG